MIHEKLVRNELTIEESIKCTTRLLINIGLYWEDEYYDLYNVDDSYELAKNGVHFDLVDVVNVYIEMSEVYSKYFCEFENLYFKVMGNEWD
ncbi:hypothetical protein IIQ_05212 [Bacillus cereus VD118]|uniref:Protein kinase n=1 Tax=Bacillus cereus VD118 TaxID=1053231 RepID=R8Q9Z3_BACCE|nr:hypothetical protein IIQ_05212 [Bacillus cereus VD118]CAH2466017.1 hypothetical protein ACOSJ1_EBGNOMHC_05783 [Bacillus mycoides KBAB4]